MLGLVIAAAVAAASADAPPSPTDRTTEVSPATVKTAKKNPNDPNRMVCKAQPNPGSHLASSVCLTQQQWDRNEETSRQFLRDVQARSGVGDNGPPQGLHLP